MVKDMCAFVLLLTTVSHVTSVSDGICRQGVCGTIRYEEILQLYRGLFISEEQMLEKEQKVLIVREKGLASKGLNVTEVDRLPGDGDSCCATTFNHVLKTKMLNTDNVERYIVHMPDASPPVYQYIPEGSCVEGYGKCDGHCFMEPLTLNLLVYDTSPSPPWPPVTFDWFEVPGYCSCKNVQSSVGLSDPVLSFSSADTVRESHEP